MAQVTPISPHPAPEFPFRSLVVADPTGEAGRKSGGN